MRNRLASQDKCVTRQYIRRGNNLPTHINHVSRPITA
ncbi:hypothetical protein KSS87_012510 [Heliosperma pusillum]|nr:hypothetical protein KSS87_012510 [Heliosperma pusillum]